MLNNAYLLAKIGADTAENERDFAENLPKILRKFAKRRTVGLLALRMHVPGKDGGVRMP